MTRSLLVRSSSSGAGKSLLATARYRWATWRDIDVAPFKAQNMSNNASVVPTVDMNPVLLKPERDTASEEALQGRVADDLSRLPWHERSARLAVAARESFMRLQSRHEQLVIEGAGAPAEINLAEHDDVNLGTARWAQAAGAFPSLVVAWQRGPVLGVDAHGLFESGAVLRALFGAEAVDLDARLDSLANFVDRHLDPGLLDRCLRA